MIRVILTNLFSKESVTYAKHLPITCSNANDAEMKLMGLVHSWQVGIFRARSKMGKLRLLSGVVGLIWKLIPKIENLLPTIKKELLFILYEFDHL
jgi:hypothetical protein